VVDEEYQNASKVFEDGDRRDACPTRLPHAQPALFSEPGKSGLVVNSFAWLKLFPSVFIRVHPWLNQNGSLPLFRHPVYFNPMTREATGLLPGLGQTAVWLNIRQD
jgi:hypothetical protein